MTDEQIRELTDSLKEDVEAAEGYAIADEDDLSIAQDALASYQRLSLALKADTTKVDLMASHESAGCLFDALFALATLQRKLEEAVRHYEEAQQRPVKWRVVRIARDMLPDEYLVPDRERIDALANAARGNDSPPIIPGVIFERKRS